VPIPILLLIAVLAGCIDGPLIQLVYTSEGKQAAIHSVRYRLTRLGVLAAHPVVFLIVFVFVALWLIFDRQNFGWAGVATISTLFMTLLIQRAEHRDTQAIHAKLDELLRANHGARSELTRLDEQEPELIERHRADAQAHDHS
jgi:low affinity Fe/Cu permease